MAMLCIAGKSWIACSLQPSQSVLAEVLFEVDDVLGDHDRVLDVVLHPFKALDTLLTSVPAAPESVTDAHSLAHVHGSVHEVVVDNGIQHPNVVSGELLDTEVLLVRFNCGAIVRGQVVPDVVSSSSDEESEVVHLVHTFRAEESGVWRRKGRSQDRKDKDSFHCEVTKVN